MATSNKTTFSLSTGFLLIAIATAVAVIISSPLGTAAAQEPVEPAATVTAVSIVSDPDTAPLDHWYCQSKGGYRQNWESGYYAIGDVIEFGVTFDRNVTVTGSPSMTISLGSDTHKRTAQYARISGNQVIFNYTVQEGDESTQGVNVPAGSISLGDNDSIASGELNADLALPALASQSDHKVDGIRPTVRISKLMPTTKTYPFGPDARYGGEDMILVNIKFSEKVAYPRYLPPSVSLDFDGDTRFATSTCRRDGYYSYDIRRGDFDSDGIALTANSLIVPSGGYIKDLVGNDAVLAHSGHTPGREFKVDARPPQVWRTRTTKDGQKVVVVFDEKISVPWGLRWLRRQEGKKISDYIIEAVTVRVDGNIAATTSGKPSDTAVSVVMETPIRFGQNVTVAYTNTFANNPAIKGVISDHFENYADSFSERSVWNKVPPLPPKPANMNVSTEQGSLEVGIEWEDIDHATKYLVRWRSVDNGEKLNEGVQVKTPRTTINVADYGTWVVRVQGCNEAGCGKPLAKRFQVQSDP